MTNFEARIARKIEEEMAERREEAVRCRIREKIAEIFCGVFLFATLCCGCGLERADSFAFVLILTLLMASCAFTAYIIAMGWKDAAEELEAREPWQR